MKRTVTLLKDDIYQLIQFNADGNPEQIFVGTLSEVEAYVSLEEKGLL